MKKFLTGILVLNLLVIDLGAGYLVYRLVVMSGGNYEEISPPKLTEGLIEDNGCDFECQQLIYAEIDKIKTETTKMPDAVTATPTAAASLPVQSVKQKIKNTTFVPIPGSGNTLNTSWTEITGTDFYLSKADYPGLTGVYFEANFKLLNGNGTANLRLFDKTHSIAPAGGEISTSSQSSVFATSNQVYLWEGNNHYAIQARSSTSDTTVFESGRLKVITEN